MEHKINIYFEPEVEAPLPAMVAGDYCTVRIDRRQQAGEGLTLYLTLQTPLDLTDLEALQLAQDTLRAWEATA